ncbi:MAG: DUF349 domain-containing protein [Bacteroidales bacterium]|nr:DUF349 domain-containing protein [Bacteroidales bacterium]
MPENQNASPAPTDEPLTREALLQAVTRLSEAPDEEISTEGINHLKQQFYQILNEEQRQQREAYAAAGGDPADFQAPEDPIEEQFKAVLNTIKERKAAYRAEIEAQRQRNYERKRAIIDELLAMSNDTDNVNRHYPQARDLQNEFKTIGDVAPEQASDVWKAYQDAVERFYDQWKVNKELRDYDFKKNLSEKQLLISEALKLDEEKDVILAFRRLQELHDKWRSIGPVAKELRDEIWGQFKDASANINKKYQSYFEERKQRERENEQAKIAICERMEALDFSKLNSYAAWEKMTKTIIGEQEEWKKLGFATRKVNNALFARFRSVCDAFFAAKAEFYTRIKAEFAENLARKEALCQQAEALQDSTDWKKASEAIIALQKEWKTVGPVAKKHSDALWRRFVTACDTFFDRKKKNVSGTRRMEQQNLRAKQDIIDALKAILDDADADRSEAVAKVQDLRQQWQATGHVPFRDKDKLYDAYREVVDKLYAKLDMRGSSNRRQAPEVDIDSLAKGDERLYRERERLARTYEQRRQELNTYENNLGFFNAKSKNGDSMLREMERKIARLKDDIAELAQKIAQIDARL